MIDCARSCGTAVVAATIIGTAQPAAAQGATQRVVRPSQAHLAVGRPHTCDPLDRRRCLLPFPSDFYTVADPHTKTGRRVAFPKPAMPANVSGLRVDPSEWNRNDGFSPQPMILTSVPDFDPKTSGVPPVTNIGASLEPTSAVVLLDANTGKRVPIWAEVDANAPAGQAPLLVVRPARNLVEGHRHIVALRRFVDRSGALISPGDAFRAYRDGRLTHDDAIEARRPAMNRVFGDLARAGIGRRDLWLAWDFTVASAESLAGRLLHMRDDAFKTLGGHAPPFRVESTEESGGVRTVRGTYDVPSYLTGDGGPGAMLNNGNAGDDPRPRRHGTVPANFVCTVPLSATSTNPARWILFGHGLLGSAEEVVRAGRLGAVVNAGFCGTDWIGMSQKDLGFLATAIGDLTKWRVVPDRLQQAHLNFVLLGRLVRAPDGLVTNPAFRDSTGAGVIDRSGLFFVGGSQGGILGGATTAVATDWTRAFLAVPGINFSLLLQRSNQFDPFKPLLAGAYPDYVDRTLLIGVIQMLWDRGENNAYAQHLTRDPYRGTPSKKVLLFEAFGDFQVANVSTEILARTINARVRQPALAPGRSHDIEPFWGLQPIPKLPFDGSALVPWDYGTPTPPTEDLPPRIGSDPHTRILDTIPAVLMASQFLRNNGVVSDPCANQP